MFEGGKARMGDRVLVCDLGWDSLSYVEKARLKQDTQPNKTGKEKLQCRRKVRLVMKPFAFLF